MQTLARDLVTGSREMVSGDGFNTQIDATGAIVDGKPLYFLETYNLENGVKSPMVESKSFKTVKAMLATLNN